jgi:hypothetical protein
VGFADWAALQQLWVFIVFPLIGAVVGVVLFLVLDDTRLEDTMLAEVPGLTEVRDTLDKVSRRSRRRRRRRGRLTWEISPPSP